MDIYRNRVSIRELISKAVALILSLSCATAFAMGLQISPYYLSLPIGSKAQELWLSNSSNRPLQVQLRAYQWEQGNHADILTPTTNLIISPPMVKIPARNKVLVRVLRPKSYTGSSPVSAFRLLISELPRGATKKGIVDFVMEYSVPVFVYHKDPEQLKVNPIISLVIKEEKAWLSVTNHGDTYGKIYDPAFIDPQGKRSVLRAGLVGYVLPNQEMQWEIGKPGIFAQGGTLELFVNGQIYAEVIAPFRR